MLHQISLSLLNIEGSSVGRASGKIKKSEELKKGEGLHCEYLPTGCRRNMKTIHLWRCSTAVAMYRSGLRSADGPIPSSRGHVVGRRPPLGLSRSSRLKLLSHPPSRVEPSRGPPPSQPSRNR
ncbi:hypothetical protein GE061_014065 [Apolygus lucorum]|uniref:Uncharacterized protein n=1 Tax=Apolygus lucorum TaxID=248454 RepID=A0A8S9XPG5_APOLU|nr:hypothetical protein GE061_014065 [Apolygus lucorum]